MCATGQRKKISLFVLAASCTSRHPLPFRVAQILSQQLPLGKFARSLTHTQSQLGQSSIFFYSALHHSLSLLFTPFFSSLKPHGASKKLFKTQSECSECVFFVHPMSCFLFFLKFLFVGCWFVSCIFIHIVKTQNTRTDFCHDFK